MQAAMDALFSVATAALLIRWAHVVFGIIWMGHLYFFNLVNVPFQGGLDKELKPKVNPALLLRAFWWFRWAAMYTFIFGWLLFFWHYLGPEHYLIDQTTGVMSGRAMWILYGALLGSITQRPSGIAPFAAIVAATRAILNGVTRTGPCP